MSWVQHSTHIMIGRAKRVYPFTPQHLKQHSTHSMKGREKCVEPFSAQHFKAQEIIILYIYIYMSTFTNEPLKFIKSHWKQRCIYIMIDCCLFYVLLLIFHVHDDPKMLLNTIDSL